MKAKDMRNKTQREDLIDIDIAEERSKEKGRPFREFLASAAKKPCA